MHISKDIIGDFLSELSKKSKPHTIEEWRRAIEWRISLITELAEGFYLKKLGNYQLYNIEEMAKSSIPSYVFIKDIPSIKSELDWFDINVRGVFDIDPYSVIDPLDKEKIILWGYVIKHPANYQWVEIIIKTSPSFKDYSLTVNKTTLDNLTSTIASCKNIYKKIGWRIRDWHKDNNQKTKAINRARKMFLIQNLFFDSTELENGSDFKGDGALLIEK